MKIFTSYYAKVPHLPYGYVPISISRSKSRYVKVDYEIPELAPQVQYDEARASMYLMAYWKQLALLNPLKVMGNIARESGWINDRNLFPVLLCHEKPESFCHRHLAAEWLRAHGYDCTELAFSEEHAARYDDHIPTTLIDQSASKNT